jgi:pyruvate,orthophosphate dikinase
MIPLVGFPKELKLQIDIVHASRRSGEGKKDPVQLPRRHDDRDPARHLGRDEIAKDAEFFSFGTNDLTQTTLGMSRDDSAASFRITRSWTLCLTIPLPRSTRKGRPAHGDHA